jgi:DNA-binding HxlR family transcriptional regulator
MKTDEQIDTWIIRSLTEKATLHYMGLLEYTRKSYRHISLDTFNSHIKKMLLEGYIGKDDTGERGKKVYYFLTEKTKQMERLRILNFKSKKEIAELNNQSKEERRLSAYIVIFFLGLRYYYPLKTEKELKNFLSEAGVSVNDLVLYSKPKPLERNGKPYERTGWETRSDIIIIKYEELTSLTPNKNIFYTYSLPGQSPREVSLESERILAHANITQAEIEDAFKIAQREGILKIVMKFRNELRYEIADKSLVNFIDDCRGLFRLILKKLQIVWRTIRGPNDQEIKWLELIKGRKGADAIRMQAYQQRHSLNKSKRKQLVVSAKKEIMYFEEEIQEFITNLVESHTNTINKYRLPTERILEIVAPKALQKTDLRRISPKHRITVANQ